jgi:hypothetical protein
VTGGPAVSEAANQNDSESASLSSFSDTIVAKGVKKKISFKNKDIDVPKKEEN